MKVPFPIPACFLLIAAGNTLSAPGASGKEADLNRFLNRYPNSAGTRLDTCALCHPGLEYGKLNPFAEDYKSAGRSDAAFGAIESTDSDQDGFVNLDEILSLTFPGNSSDIPPTPTPSPLPAPTHTRAPVVLAVEIRNATGNFTETVDPSANREEIAGGDFLAAITTSDASGLATYSQRVGFNSDQVRFMDGLYQSGLIAEFGKKPGSAVVNTVHSVQGPDSHLDCTASGIAGYTGPQDLLLMGFEVVADSGSGEFTIRDNPESTAPYANQVTENLPHTSPGESGDYSIENTGPTFTPVPVTATPTPAETPSADLNGDGFVNEEDLLILIRHWHAGEPQALR